MSAGQDKRTDFSVAFSINQRCTGTAPKSLGFPAPFTHEAEAFHLCLLIGLLLPQVPLVNLGAECLFTSPRAFPSLPATCTLSSHMTVLLVVIVIRGNLMSSCGASVADPRGVAHSLENAAPSPATSRLAPLWMAANLAFTPLCLTCLSGRG